MRNVVALGAAALLTGCAVHQAARPRIISTEWAAVEALNPGTNVALTVKADDVRIGEIESVTATSISLREPRGIAIVSRTEIERVTVREATGTRKWPRVVRGAAIGLAITAVPAYIAMAIDENGSAHGDVSAFLLLGPGIGAALGSIGSPEPTFRERIVYVRP